MVSERVSYGTPAGLIVALHICCFVGIVATVAAMAGIQPPKSWMMHLMLPGGWFLGMLASLIGSVQPTLRGGFLAWATLYWLPILLIYVFDIGPGIGHG
jgi:hypothetical protein